MPRTLLVPLQITPQGRFATTADPKQVLEQQLIDLLATHWGERVMRPEHGVNMQSYLFAPTDPELLNMKAAEVKSVLNSAIGFGQVVDVSMRLTNDSASTVRVLVYYQVFEQGKVEQLDKTFSGFLDEESVL